MDAKEQFEVNVRTIGLLALVAGLVGLVGWIAGDSGEYIMEISVLLTIGIGFLAAPSAVVVWAYNESESTVEDA